MVNLTKAILPQLPGIKSVLSARLTIAKRFLIKFSKKKRMNEKKEMHKTCYKQYRKNKCGNGKISREGKEREKWTNKYGAHCPSFATVCGPVTVNCNCVSGTLTVNAAERVKIVGRNGKSGCRRLCPCFARASSWPTYCCCCINLPIPLSLSLSLCIGLFRFLFRWLFF